MVSKINAERLAAGLFGMALASAGMAQDAHLSPGQTDLPLGGSLSAGPLVQISGESPFGALDSCGNFPGTVGTPGSNFLNSEIEPWVDVNPANLENIVAYWQQDRWSNGGARSLVAGVSLDGGSTWETVVVPGLTDCSGGKFERASDPWLSFSPDGTLHQISLSFNIDPPSNLPALFGPNALLVSKSKDGGLTWSDPITIIEDSDPHSSTTRSQSPPIRKIRIWSMRLGTGSRTSMTWALPSKDPHCLPARRMAGIPGKSRARFSIRAWTTK